MRVRQILAFICSLVIGLTFLPRPAAAASATVVISEVQLQSTQSATEEFVELYNASSVPVEVSDWRVEYVTSAATTTGTALVTLQGRIAPESFVLVSKADYLPQADFYFDKGLSDTSGHIRVVNAAGQEVDRVGWGTAAAPEGTAVAAPAKGKTLRREADAAAPFKDTDNNRADFVADIPDPVSGGLLPSEEPPATSCKGVVLNEIVSNPVGADADGGEFVELHNPTNAAVSLKGCTLVTDKMIATGLPDFILVPGSYYVVDLKDKLLNGKGRVTLVTADTEEAVMYPELSENEAWALFGAEWKSTLQPTPGAANALTEKIDDTLGQGSGENTVTPCSVGKYRNPETNRCKNIETPEVAATCKPGQVRNPETNRCRAVASAGTGVLASCGPGQERNPTTNRCRKVAATTASSTKSCPAGQERNPSTGRCRKAASTPAARTDDSAANQTGDRLNLGIMAIAGTTALGYGAFEYRSEIRNWVGKLKAKLPFTSAGT